MNIPGFLEKKILGKGTYGEVYKAVRLSDSQTYGVKVVNLSTLNHREIEDSVNEIRLMASFTSPFIVRFYEAFIESRRLCIVTEYARLGDLAHLIERRKRANRPLQENDIWRYFIQLLEGLKVLHSVGVVHRDLKSANILLSAPDLIKIADLGVSTVLRTTQLARTQIGTPLYLAPEVWKCKPYDSKCDMWSLGVLLYEMMTFNYPFLGRTQQDLARRICAGYYTPPRGYSSDLTSLVRRLLQVSPAMRPSVSEILDMQCVRQHMYLLTTTIQHEGEENIPQEKLLSTIKVPQNIKNVNLPNPSYGKKPNIVKPIEQRMHLKQGAPLRKELCMVSSPELKMIVDRDWWSPTKDSRAPKTDDDIKPVMSPTSVRGQYCYRPVKPQKPGVADCLHWEAPPAQRKHEIVPINPRFRRMALR